MLTATTPDGFYRWYYEAYAPFDPHMAPPIPRSTSFFHNWLALIYDFWPRPWDEQTIRAKIAQQEFTLEELFGRLDMQERHAREIDTSDVTAWPEKYNAWWWSRQTRVQIQEVSSANRISSICS